MKLLSLMILTISLSMGNALAETKKPMDPKQEEMMKKFHEYATPGEAHKVLKDIAGKWTYTTKFWESESATPHESKGSAKMTMILGGRFLQQEVKGKGMDKMDYEGMGLIGYDNVKKKYITTWIDNMGTGIMEGEGQFNASTKMLTEEGEFTCPMTKDQEADYRGEWVLTDKNNMTYSMYGKGMKDEGKEFKMMEITYKRKK